jgi:hypothetical protein
MNVYARRMMMRGLALLPLLLGACGRRPADPQP